MSTKSNETLEEMIKNLQASVDKGFDGVHERQDYTNGKVLQNTEHRIKMESALAVYKWLFGFLGIGNIALVAKVFI